MLVKLADNTSDSTVVALKRGLFFYNWYHNISEITNELQIVICDVNVQLPADTKSL